MTIRTWLKASTQMYSFLSIAFVYVLFTAAFFLLYLAFPFLRVVQSKYCFPTGRQDSSGVRFYYTSHLREFDAGIFAVGIKISPFLVIPPKQESWLTVGYCPKECHEVGW